MTPIWTTQNFSASNAWESIACSKGGRNSDWPTKKFCVRGLNVLTRFTHFCNADELAGTTRRTRSPCGPEFCRSIPFLGQARLHLFRRTNGPDCDHAGGAGRKEKMDQPVALSACAELLYVVTRSGSATTGDLHRLASAQDLGWHRRRYVLCYPF